MEKLYTCEYCNKIITITKPQNITLHLQYCEDYKKHIKSIELILTKDFLIEHYINNGESLQYIRKLIDLKKTRLIIKKLKEHNIKVRSYKESIQQKHRAGLAKQTCQKKYGFDYNTQVPEFKEKIKKTNIEKYGVENVYQSEEIKDKIKKTNFKKYGVEYASQASEVKIKMKQAFLSKYGVENPFQADEVRKKVKETTLRRYGVEHVMQNKEIKDRCLAARFKNGYVSGVSKVSQKLFWLIYNKLSKELQAECYFAELNSEFVKYYNKYYLYDFVLSHKKKCIEFNGNYYHMNPSIYEANDINKQMKKSASEIWKSDKTKNNALINDGFDVLVIWEKDFKDNQEETINKSIKFLMNEL